MPEKSAFWQSDKHEIDFALSPDDFIEVKRGRAGPLDFGWFPKMRNVQKTRLLSHTDVPKSRLFCKRLVDYRSTPVIKNKEINICSTE